MEWIKRNWIALVAIAGGTTTVLAFSDSIEERIGFPPFANIHDVALLDVENDRDRAAIVETFNATLDSMKSEMIAASERALWLELQNAFASGDRDRIRRACQALINATGQKPSGC